MAQDPQTCRFSFVCFEARAFRERSVVVWLWCPLRLPLRLRLTPGRAAGDSERGYMLKAGGRDGKGALRRRWFVLHNATLIYYKSKVRTTTPARSANMPVCLRWSAASQCRRML